MTVSLQREHSEALLTDTSDDQGSRLAQSSFVHAFPKMVTIDSDSFLYALYVCHQLQNKASPVHSERSQCEGAVVPPEVVASVVLTPGDR